MANYVEYWVDYSGAKRTGTQVANTLAWVGGPKITGAIRYIDAPELLKTKHTNKAEYDSLIAAGLKVRLVMQDTTTDADGGYAAGVARAQRAKAGADYLGYTGVIFFTNDRTTIPNVKTWQDYLDGAASVLGRARVGAYGFANAMNAAVGHASAFWQAGAESELVGHANYYQWNNGRIYIDGLEADLDKVIKDYVPGLPHVESDDEDMAVVGEIVEADDYIVVPCNGKSGLFLGVAYGRKVHVLEIWAVKDTPPGDGASVERVSGAFDWIADRPGPVALPSGTRSVTLRYNADHKFTAWCA